MIMDSVNRVPMSAEIVSNNNFVIMSFGRRVKTQSSNGQRFNLMNREPSSNSSSVNYIHLRELSLPNNIITK